MRANCISKPFPVNPGGRRKGDTRARILPALPLEQVIDEAARLEEVDDQRLVEALLEPTRQDLLDDVVDAAVEEVVERELEKEVLQAGERRGQRQRSGCCRDGSYKLSARDGPGVLPAGRGP
jgi:hypothetical protein